MLYVYISGYLKDMFSCPAPIKAYLCNLYQLQNIPVFGIKADANLANLVEEFRVFFTGDVRHNVMKSNYSGNMTTTSSGIKGRNWLQISLDKSKIKKLEMKINNAENAHEKISNTIEELLVEKRSVEQDLESKMKEVKALKVQIDLKKVLKGKVDVKKSQIEVFKRDNKPTDLAKEREKLDKSKVKLVEEDIKLALKLTENLKETRKVRQKMELLETAKEVFQRMEQRLRNELLEEKEELGKIKERLGEQEEIAREAAEKLLKQMRSAQNITGQNFKGNFTTKYVLLNVCIIFQLVISFNKNIFFRH